MKRFTAVAEISKERLYNYFGGVYRGCIFDYHAEHPHLVQLLLQETLGEGPAVNEAARTAHYRAPLR